MRLLMVLGYCLLAGLPLLMGCDPQVSSSVRVDYLVDKEEAAKLLSGRWLLMPIVPVEGGGLMMNDYGKFAKMVKKTRHGQKVVLFGKNRETHSAAQRSAYQYYVQYIQAHRKVPDSVLYIFKEGYKSQVTIVPIIFSHQVTGDESRGFQRRVAFQISGWDNRTGGQIFKGDCAALHGAGTRKELASGEKLVMAGLEAMAEKLLYDPLAGLSPESKPDF